MLCLDISEVCWTEPAFSDVNPSSSSSSLRDLSAILTPPFPLSPSNVWSSITTHDLDPTPSSSLDSVQSGMRYQVSPTASFLYPDYQTGDVFSCHYRLYQDDEQDDIDHVESRASLYDVDSWVGSVDGSGSDVSITSSYSFTSVDTYSSFSSLSGQSDVFLDTYDYDDLSDADKSTFTPSSPSLSYTDLLLPIEELGQSIPVIPLCNIHCVSDVVFSSTPASPSVSYTDLFFPVDNSSANRQTQVIPLSQSCEHCIDESEERFSRNQQSRKRKREEEEEDEEQQQHKHKRWC